MNGNNTVNRKVVAGLAVGAPLAMLGAWLSPVLLTQHRAAHIHLALAVGVMPLILAAMSHFVPVLTRSQGAGTWLGALLLLAWSAGVLAWLQFVAGMPAHAAAVAAAIALGVGIAFLGWARQRGKLALGQPHPCLNWYLAALACLILALSAIFAMEFWPAQRLPLKRFHLHLNLLGFVGLTAYATLHVLLPTVAGRPDPEAAPRLRRDLLPALCAVLLIACGAAWLPALAWLGFVLWLVLIARLARAWLRLFRTEILRWHGAAPLLAAALAGFGAALVAGTLHGAAWHDPVVGAHVYIFCFLFPLLSGAVGHLLPLWLRPGQQTAWHAQLRGGLLAGGGGRALLFLLAGGLLLAGVRQAIFVALLGLLIFFLRAVATLRGLRGGGRT